MTANHTHLISIDEVVHGLNARIMELCLELLPRGKKIGNEWEVGSINGEPGRSFKVHLSGAKVGKCKDFAGGFSGDALDLIAEVHYGADKKQALRWAKRWLGLEAMHPAELQRQRERLAANALAAEEAAARDDQQNSDRARKLWLASHAEILNTPVDTYLAGRGILLSKLPRLPGALRYAPDLYNTESERKWPAMTASIVRLGDGIVGCHRTWLTVRGDSSVVKAPLEDAKKSYGRIRGGFIPLSRGESGKRMEDAVAGESCMISEGIEDGMTMAMARPLIRTISAVSLDNMMRLILPPAIEEIIIIGQNDAAGSTAAFRLEQVVETFRRQGRRVRVAMPPKGVKDFNELIRKDNPAKEETA